MNQMNKYIRIMALFIFLSIAIFLGMNYIQRSDNERMNIVNNRNVIWSKEWVNRKSIFSGSEINFSVVNTKSLSVRVQTPKSDPSQEIEVTVEGKAYYIESPDLSKKELTIHLDNESFNNQQDVRVRFFCIYQEIPCEILIQSITVDKQSKILSPPAATSTLAILGDSISSIFGSKNYSRYLADSLGLHLHNASMFHSTISNTGSEKDAIGRYTKDVSEYRPEYILVAMGTNDILKNIPLNIFEQSYSEIIDGLDRYSHPKRIFLSGIMHSKGLNNILVDKYNFAIKSIAESNNQVYIDTNEWLTRDDFLDDIHPSIQAQDKLKNNFYEILSTSL